MLLPDYTVISLAQARKHQEIAWHRSKAADRQDAAYRALLDEMNAAPRIDLVVAAQAVDAISLPLTSLLEF